MVRLYSNENFPLPVVEKLRALGDDVLTIQETGKADHALPDDVVLKFATAENRAVLTLNRRHFIRLHQENPAHAGIIVCTVDPDFVGQAERIHKIVGGQSSLNAQLIRDSSKPASKMTKAVPQLQTEVETVKAIREAGRTPVPRNTFCEPIKVWESLTRIKINRREYDRF